MAPCQGRDARHIMGISPAAVHLVDHKRQPDVVGGDVGTAGGAVARRATRHRFDVGEGGGVEGAAAAEDLLHLVPAAAAFVGNVRHRTIQVVELPGGGTV